MYNGIAGGIDQNAGGTQSLKYGENGKYAVLGESAVNRAFADGFTANEIIDWANRVQASVGDKAKKLLNII